MKEVSYRTVLMDRTDLRTAIADIERDLNSIRQTLSDDGIKYILYDIEMVAAKARTVLALTEGEYP